VSNAPHDARARRSPDGQIPSFVTPIRSGSPAPIANRSAASGPAAGVAPNVIPFTKPRAIAAVAASPGAVVTMAPAGSSSSAQYDPYRDQHRQTQRHATPPMPMHAVAAPSRTAGSPASSSQNVSDVWPGAVAPTGQAIRRDAAPPSGWTPPHPVKAVAQTAAPLPAAIAVTAWPAPSGAAAPMAQTVAQPAQLAVAHAHAHAHGAYAAHAAPAASAHVHAHAHAAYAAHAAHAALPRTAAQMAVAMPAADLERPTQVQPAPVPQKWSVYNALGLGPPKLRLPKIGSQQMAKLIVNAYRLLGFGILTIIVIVLVGYIASTAFYYFSNSWIVPLAVSPTDEKVVSLQAQLAEQQNARDRIVDELQQAERAILSQQTFQAEFARAIRSDLEGRKLALGRIRELATSASKTRAAIKSQNAAYANASRQRMAQEYAAGLIDRTAMLSGKYQLAQISSSNLSLAERQAEFETRAAELEAQTRSLDAILTNAQGSGGPALSYEVLRIKQEYEASRLDLAKSTETRDTLKAALARQTKIVASLQQSAYLRAVRDKAQVAFVPYGNLSGIEKGTSLYGCKLGMLFCYHVGEILEVLPGEVQFKHPQRDRMLRGQVVVLKLDADDQGAAADDVLFVGGRPVLF
jgi:hypothetical protein